jgi:predicted permease
VPATDVGLHFTLAIKDRPAVSGETFRAREILVSPGYFRVLETPVTAGREFNEDDKEGRLRVAIVDQSTAHRCWSDDSALGRRIRMGQGDWMTVVGVVKDVRQGAIDMTGEPTVYVPMYQPFDVAAGYVVRDAVILARTPLAASALEPGIRREVERVDPGLPVYGVTSMDTWINQSLASRRFAADLVGGFAATAVLLASLGTYGLLAFLVGQRTREIGLRMALGASHADVLTPILSRGVALAATGIAAGVLLSAAAVSMIASVLYGVRPHDPIVFATVPVLLLTFAAVASYLPARRATKIDPMRALGES